MINYSSLLAAVDPIGTVAPPGGIFSTPAISATGEFIGVMILLNSLLKLVFVVAGLFAFINLILAGFAFISSGGDAKAIAKAMEKIYYTLIGLVIIVCSFLLAAIFGLLLFRDSMAILNPKL